MRHDFDGGKYTVINDNGNLSALRNGEPWQDLCGNNLVYWMLVEVDNLKRERAELLGVLKKIGAHTITDEDGDEIEVLFGDIDEIRAAIAKATGGAA